MIEEEYDRLAWGFVKEELRNLLKPRNKDLTANIVGKILKPGIETRGPESGFYLNGPLTPKRVAEIQAEIESQFKSIFMPFREVSMRARMGPEYGFAPAKTYQFWNVSERKVTSSDEDEIEDETSPRIEKMLDLYQFTLSMNKKKLVGDLTSCFVLLSQHTLYRMIQRGLVEREPLKHLSDNLFDWLRHVAHILFSYSFTAGATGERFFIPYANGALLCNVGRTNRKPNDLGCSVERLRYQDGVIRSTAGTPPYKPCLEALESPDAHYVMKISTWIPDSYFSVEQHWAYDAMQKLDDKFHRLFSSLTWLLMPDYTIASTSKFKSKEESLDSIHQYIDEFTSIVTDPKWLIATGTL